MPDFYQSLRDGGVTELVLRFLILTSVRPKSVRFCHLDQIDGDVWTVPAETMKGRKNKTTDFRVPLSQEALAVIEAAKPFPRRMPFSERLEGCDFRYIPDAIHETVRHDRATPQFSVQFP